jgi:hypothetical protein
LQQAFDAVEKKIGAPKLILGCDSLRQGQEREQAGTDRAVGELLARHHAVGFSGHGQQYNAMYVNQTLSAVALSLA